MHLIRLGPNIMLFDDVAVLEVKGWKSGADFNNIFPTGAKSEINPLYK